MDDVLTWLEGASRYVLSILPADRSVAVITVWAVWYGTACWLIGKTLVYGFNYCSSLSHRLLQKPGAGQTAAAAPTAEMSATPAAP